MTLTFPLAAADWRAFREHHIRSDPKTRRIRMAGIIGPVVFLVALSGVLVLGGKDVVFRAAGLVALAIVWFVAFQAWAAALSGRIVAVLEGQSTRVRYEGVHVVKIQTSGVEHKYQVTDSSLSWTDIQRVENTRDYLFLYESPTTAIIIPRAKLPSDADFDSCVQLARSSFARASQSLAAGPRE